MRGLDKPKILFAINQQICLRICCDILSWRSTGLCLCVMHGEGASTLQSSLQSGAQMVVSCDEAPYSRFHGSRSYQEGGLLWPKIIVGTL